MPAKKMKPLTRKVKIPQKGKVPEPAYRKIVQGLRKKVEEAAGDPGGVCCVQGCCVSWCCIQVIVQ